MKWWDFSDTNFIIFFTIMVCCISLIVCLATSFGFIIGLQNKYYKDIKKSTNTTRVFTIDTRNNLVIYFDTNSIGKRRRENISSFYNGFHPDDQEKVKSWIYDICVKNKQVDEYLQSDVVIHKSRNNYFSLIRLVKYDSEKGILHLENYILPFITPNNSVHKSKDLTGLQDKNTMREMVEKQKSQDGFTFEIRLFNTQSHLSTSQNVEQLMILIPKNAVYTFIKDKHHPRQLVENSINDVLLFDLRIESKEDALILASSISREIEKQISINGLENFVTFSIGVVQNSQYYQDFDSIVATAQQACIYAQQSNLKYYLFERNSSSPVVETGQYKKEIDRLLQPNLLHFLYRPIIDCASGKVIGYFNYVKSYSTPFNGYMEMSKYAARVNKNRELFGLVAKHTINKFANERLDPLSILFLQVSLVDSTYIIDTLEQIPSAKQIELVLMIEENEINNNSSQLNVIESYILSLKNSGIKVALLLDDKNLVLSNDIYYKFDYFVIKALPQIESRKDERMNFSIRSLAEQLLKYKKPIIATDIETIAAVEFTIKSGINIVSSDTIAHASEMILPIEKRKLDKIKAINGK